MQTGGERPEGSLSRMQAGDHHHRAWVGPPEHYDVSAALQFSLFALAGLREHHTMLDIGCGSLKAGRLFIPYLLAGHYFGLEPEAWLIDEAIEHELGRDLIELKRPTFADDSDFTLTTFGTTFDFLLAQSIFSHASGPRISRCLSEARAVMDTKSLFFASFMPGVKDHGGEEWVYPGVARYREETFVGFVESEGFEIRLLDWPHPEHQRWAVIGFDLDDVVARIDGNPLVARAERDVYARRLDRILRSPIVRNAIRVDGMVSRVRRRFRKTWREPR